MLDIWEAESNIRFNKLGSGVVKQDINQNNYTEFLDQELGYNLIILDDSGSIIDDLIGSGAKNNILGFAGSSIITIDSNNNVFIKEAQALFNGFLFSARSLAKLGLIHNQSDIINEFQTTILHEFAHMLGIDHTQGGFIDTFNNNDGSADLSNFPVMFPISANTDIKLHRDDISAISLAYPKNSLQASSTGTISGKVKKLGKSIKGANVIAYNIANPETESIAVPSDIKGQGDGKFEFKFLTPGSYILKIEPINSNFTGGSSIGIHDPNATVSTGFYNGPDAALLTGFKLR